VAVDGLDLVVDVERAGEEAKWIAPELVLPAFAGGRPAGRKRRIFA
jgi:hypothetical protein